MPTGPLSRVDAWGGAWEAVRRISKTSRVATIGPMRNGNAQWTLDHYQIMRTMHISGLRLSLGPRAPRAPRPEARTKGYRYRLGVNKFSAGGITL